MKIEKIKIIVREHLDDDPFEKAIADANEAEPKGSTVGVKISVGGELYGTYVCFKQSTLSASEVAECINEQFETLIKGLEKTECTQIIRYPTLYEALEDIIWYDNHSDWLKKLCVNIEKAKEEGHNFSEFPFDEWHTEKHTIWMLLVGMFGDWGTSIRSGWIEKHDECIAFINNITKNSLEES